MMDGCCVRSFGEARFSEVLFLWAVLMVIVTFQAGLDPPGGVWPDNGYHNATLSSPSPTPNAFESSPPKQVHHYAGKSVMSYVDPKRYKYFSLFNDVAFYSSTLVIVLLLRRGHSWALKLLPTISVVAISVSIVFSLSFSSPYDISVTRSWTFLTRIVLLCTSEILLSIIVRHKFPLPLPRERGGGSFEEEDSVPPSQDHYHFSTPPQTPADLHIKASGGCRPRRSWDQFQNAYEIS